MKTTKKRPMRLTRIFTYAPLYFVTFCTCNRRALLANDLVHSVFKTGVIKANDVGNTIGRYVIMPDHIHMFMRIAFDQRLGVTVKFLKEFITKRLHQYCPGTKVWQPGFFDHILRTSESYGEKWEYVRENPVRKGLVLDAGMWPYQGEGEIIKW